MEATLRGSVLVQHQLPSHRTKGNLFCRCNYEFDISKVVKWQEHEQGGVKIATTAWTLKHWQHIKSCPMHVHSNSKARPYAI